MSDCKPVGTPMDPSVKLSNPKGEHNVEGDKLPYRELVGALNYLAVGTRPDISFACSFLGQLNNHYDKTHWVAAKRVLRYLKGTMDVGLFYTLTDKLLSGFVDADWGGNLADQNSYTGICFIWSGGPSIIIYGHI
ncbi:uncharacterized protein [Temnothorax longispinosus]|uniref:uncharacterized protein n=1 Tax=Temnothorax longispinosus TaxID=300112 RepID=UPI003A99E33F